MRQNSSVGLNTKPEKIPPKPLLPSLSPTKHLQLDSSEHDPLSPKRKGKLLKSQRAPFRRSTQSWGVTWQNPALLLTRGWRRQPGYPTASPRPGLLTVPSRSSLPGLQEASRPAVRTGPKIHQGSKYPQPASLRERSSASRGTGASSAGQFP